MPPSRRRKNPRTGHGKAPGLGSGTLFRRSEEFPTPLCQKRCRIWARFCLSAISADRLDVGISTQAPTRRSPITERNAHSQAGISAAFRLERNVSKMISSGPLLCSVTAEAVVDAQGDHIDILADPPLRKPTRRGSVAVNELSRGL